MLAKDSSDFHPFSHVIEHRGGKSELDEHMLAKDSGDFHPFSHVIEHRGWKK